MKKFLLSLSVILSMSLVAFANNGDPVKTETTTTSTTESISLNHIFIADYEGEALFIDFEAVNDPIVALTVVKDDKVMMEDNVVDLPDNTIYELNLSVMRAGTYTLELLTKEGISIQKEIVIK